MLLLKDASGLLQVPVMLKAIIVLFKKYILPWRWILKPWPLLAKPQVPDQRVTYGVYLLLRWGRPQINNRYECLQNIVGNVGVHYQTREASHKGTANNGQLLGGHLISKYRSSKGHDLPKKNNLTCCKTMLAMLGDTTNLVRQASRGWPATSNSWESTTSTLYMTCKGEDPSPSPPHEDTPNLMKQATRGWPTIANFLKVTS